jgi:hypothetical protein
MNTTRRLRTTTSGTYFLGRPATAWIEAMHPRRLPTSAGREPAQASALAPTVEDRDRPPSDITQAA